MLEREKIKKRKGRERGIGDRGLRGFYDLFANFKLRCI